MNLGLEIFPVWDEDDSTRIIKTPDCLKFDRDVALFAQLLGTDWGKNSQDSETPRPKIETHELNRIEVETYSERGLVRKTHDKLGALTFAYARDLKRLEVGGARNAGGRNVAIKAYIDALPDHLMVVLYWC